MDQQLQLHRQIHRFLENFKKLGRKNYTSAMVRSRIKSLKELWMRFNDDHVMLESTIPKASRTNVSYFTDNYYDDTEESYNLALDHLAEVLEELEPPPSPNRSIDGSFTRAQPSAFTLSHLPVIQLPPFDGSASDWESFRDRFTAIIIENRELHDFSRMHYLMSFLRGRALECLSGLAISDENFVLAWQILKDRYDNKRRLISTHMSTLLNLPRLSRESAVDIQSLTSKVKLALASLANLQHSPADLWNDFLVHIVVQHLDSTTRRAWTLRAHDGLEPHTFASLDRFLCERIRALEDIAREPSRAPTVRSTDAPRVHNANVSSPSHPACPICNARHYFSSCDRFLNGNSNQRRDLVKKHRRCFNCLSSNHSVSDCLSKFSCRRCHKRHHSLLHGSSDSETRLVADAAPVHAAQIADRPDELNAMVAAAPAARRVPVLLTTARVRVRSSSGRVAVVRALLDQGSEVTLVSNGLAQSLKARRLRLSTSISAVGCVSTGPVRCAVDLTLSPAISSVPSFGTTAMVLGSLTSYAPRQCTDLSKYEHLSGLTWADPNPCSRDSIEIIIGSDLYGALLREGVRLGPAGQPIAQQTALGWIISGPIGKLGSGASSSRPSDDRAFRSDVVSSCHCLGAIDNDLRRFWEVEDIPRSSPRTPEDERCESHFASTHSRTPAGRYRVRIPFKQTDSVNIGSSRGRALQSLTSLLRRFQRDSRCRHAYVEFMRDYESLGHMRRVTESSLSPAPRVYIPHHPVFRFHGREQAIRVVFNASSITSNGTNLNAHILVGPKLQSDLSAVLLRWRNFRFAYCADIAKMYRQILVDERDVDFQRILWSESDSESLSEFQLLTVTYGMACAPFLALRVIQQLREDDGHDHPLASQILENNTYVDDVLFGGDSPEEALHARAQLVSLLDKGCFPLRKWSSNSRALLADIPEDQWGMAGSRALSPSDGLKVLGITWLPSDDAFCFNVALPEQIPQTKRAILSLIAKLYDPLGWVTPVTLPAKIFLQSLWRHKLAWDETLPSDLGEQWDRTFKGLSQLSGLHVPRWTGFGHSISSLELHGFADASNSAYAAVVFCRLVSASGDVTVSLMASKSRVAPLKILSVPRLELCAAVMLARLIEFVRGSISVEPARCCCWSDSTVVLSWLARHPSQWKTFVAHRVEDIQSRLPDVQWRHVPTVDNPADCASRGLLGDQLRSHALWWQGPPWLSKADSRWPNTLASPPEDIAVERRVACFHAEIRSTPLELVSKFSSWPRMIRVLAYIRRFSNACKRVHSSGTASGIKNCALRSEECSAARSIIIKSLQHALFPTELQILENHRPLPSKSPLLSLSPFLDAEGIMRVGGRLSRAPFPFGRRHPILLSHHSITDSIIDHAHTRSLHAGIQLTLNVLRQDFWVIRARSVVRNRIHRCIVCTRERASTSSQLMSDLPNFRISAPSRPFLHVGIDYAGPVHVRVSSGRGIKPRKSFIALFICLATRAIHLELVSDYSSPTFINAFSRFSARRGLPHTVYSDNGTTFVGADKELTMAYRTAMRDTKFLNSIASDGIQWKFIPPSAPHFGGLWEAGVKSVKHHLRRVTQNHTLTVEEFSTLLCRIEACVNSRPIAPLSDSLDDYEPLTPGHFLIGSAITTHSEPSLLDLNENRLTRWQLVHHMTERFWHLWYSDYVNLLQQRSKWKKVQPPLKLGRMVLIRNPNLPPCKWELGRVTRCHPGSDGLIRVVTVKTANSELVRPVVRLCVLPIECERPDNSVKSPDAL